MLMIESFVSNLWERNFEEFYQGEKKAHQQKGKIKKFLNLLSKLINLNLNTK